VSSLNSKIKSIIKERKSCLCVGLDISPEGIGSKNLIDLKNHTFKVIDATREFAVAYKPNFAFFERWGAAGFSWLEETVDYIGLDYIKIADAKRGDIGNTAKQYAEGIFSHFGFDCVTLSPYMGRDSIEPFLNNPKKGAFVLCRTSNSSAKELQDVSVNGVPFYEQVVQMAKELNNNDNIGLVIGATAPNELDRIRNIVPEFPLLIPGIGVQGGDLNHSVKVGNRTGAALINISRSINFAGNLCTNAINKTAANYVEQMQESMI